MGRFHQRPARGWIASDLFEFDLKKDRDLFFTFFVDSLMPVGLAGDVKSGGCWWAEGEKTSNADWSDFSVTAIPDLICLYRLDVQQDVVAEETESGRDRAAGVGQTLKN